MPKYTHGPTYARSPRPTFEFKPSSTNHTGGGYARIRSTEYRDHTPGDTADDVYVAVHRLAAVAWHLDDGTLGTDVHLSELDGMDVHHTQSDRDKRGMPSANGEDWTTLVSHSGHSEITQLEMRAYGEDAKRSVENDPDPERCVQCDDTLDSMACESVEWEGRACHECAKELSDDSPIKVV